MGKPNTKPFDRMIATAEAKLTAVRNGEISSLNAGEQTRVFFHIGRGVRRVIRGKGTSGPDRAIDRIFEGAEERYAADVTEAKKARQKLIGDAAAARVAKRAESKWW